MASVAKARPLEGGVERFQMAHRVAGKPVYWVSAYRVGDVLVDSGCAWARADVARYLAQHDITTCLTTHEHEDHVGNHSLLAGGRCEVFAPKRAVDILENGPPRLPFYRWLAWRAHDKARGVKPVPDAVTASGRRFKVLHTPGHSADHVVYVDEDASAVFTGDAYMGKLKAVRAKEDVPLQMESVRRIAEMDLAWLYPAHGPVLSRPRAKLLETADHFDAMREKAVKLAEKGLSPRRIRQQLMGSEPWLTYYSLGAFSAENLVRSLLGRLGTSTR